MTDRDLTVPASYDPGLVEPSRRVSIVPHTHWDREWYEPFQAFRYRLVRLVDGLLDVLDSTPGYRRFLLDGQTQLIDDYVALRPQAASRIVRLVGDGRLSIGPWRVLMDEAMVSGESLVRDLQMGLARGSDLGGEMEVGYLPDMFHHVAQMPQLLALAGIADAVLWRGVPRVIDTTGFWWEAPDGSRVRAEYLFGSYANGAAIPPTGESLVDLAQRCESEVGDGLVGALLLMHGRDHMAPVPWLPDVVEAANAAQREHDFAIVSLAEHVAAQPRDHTLAVWRGELRSGARANVLMGTASNHVDVHQACAAAERALERVAEPLAALWLPGAGHPHAALALAWEQLVLNSAHDSSCACSADDTITMVNARYAEARHLAEAVTTDALGEIAARVGAPAGAVVVVNPTARTRGGVVEVEPAQPETAVTTVLQGRKVHWLITLMRDSAAQMRAVELDERDGELHVTLWRAAAGDDVIFLEPALERMRDWGERDGVQRVTVIEPAIAAELVAVDAVPGFGWTVVDDSAAPPAVRADGFTLANEHVTVTVDAGDGTWSVTTASGVQVAGLGRLVDGGDGGDTYTYSPPPADVLVDRPTAVRAAVVERGPLRAAFDVVATYEWPTHALGDHRWVSARASTTTPVTVTTRLELRAGEPWVRVEHSFDNPCRDHRLRAHFPLPCRVGGSDAESAFCVVHRKLVAEGGPQEHGTPTFVSRRFVDCSDAGVGLGIVHDGLLEYEVVDEGHELALTLLRSTGWLSRATMQYRAEPAGPFVATPGAQLLGPRSARYAVYVHDGDWEAADLYAAADAVLVPLRAVRATGGGTADPGAAPLEVTGAEVSAVHRSPDDALLVRVFRASATHGDATVRRNGAPARGDVVDLRGRVVAPFDGTLPLRPWQIVTLRLE